MVSVRMVDFLGTILGVWYCCYLGAADNTKLSLILHAERSTTNKCIRIVGQQGRAHHIVGCCRLPSLSHDSIFHYRLDPSVLDDDYCDHIDSIFVPKNSLSSTSRRAKRFPYEKHPSSCSMGVSAFEWRERG